MLLTVGDGAACVLVERHPGPGFLSMLHGTEASLARAMEVRTPFPPATPGARYAFEVQDATATSAFIASRWRGLFHESLAATGTADGQLAHWFFHQTHGAQVTSLLKDLGVASGQDGDHRGPAWQHGDADLRLRNGARLRTDPARRPLPAAGGRWRGQLGRDPGGTFLMPAARIVIRWRVAVAAWVLAATLLVPQAATLREVLDVDARIEGSESARIDALLAGPLASRQARTAVLVVSDIPALETLEGADVLRSIVEPLSRSPDVESVHSWLDAADTIFRRSGSFSTFAVVGLAPERTAPEQQIARLRQQTEVITRRLRITHPDAALRWTGQTALNIDLRSASSRDVERAERRALPITAGLLVLGLRRLGCGDAATGLRHPGHRGDARSRGDARPLHLSVPPASKCRLDARSRPGHRLRSPHGEPFSGRPCRRIRPQAAAEEASRRAGHTILLSAATVALGFLALLIVPLNEVRSVGVGGLLVVITSALLATTAAPRRVGMAWPASGLGTCLAWWPSRDVGAPLATARHVGDRPSMGCAATRWRAPPHPGVAGGRVAPRPSARQLAATLHGVGAGNRCAR
jgi:hypothetical protein